MKTSLCTGRDKDQLVDKYGWRCKITTWTYQSRTIFMIRLSNGGCTQDPDKQTQNECRLCSWNPLAWPAIGLGKMDDRIEGRSPYQGSLCEVNLGVRLHIHDVLHGSDFTHTMYFTDRTSHTRCTSWIWLHIHYVLHGSDFTCTMYLTDQTAQCTSWTSHTQCTS